MANKTSSKSKNTRMTDSIRAVPVDISKIEFVNRPTPQKKQQKKK